MHRHGISCVVGAILLLSFTGCSTGRIDVAPSVDLTDASLRPRVGQRITVTGLWNSNGMQGPYVSRPEKSVDGMIYVKGADDLDWTKLSERTHGIQNGASVEVTGVLRWYNSPPVPPGMDPQFYQRAPDHFYFDAADTSIKVVP